ncbi:Glycoside hydrolase family 38 central domain, partial [Trinorchestia longiramus]
MQMTTPDALFTTLEAEQHNFCQWTGELYLELHNGTYTSQAAMKRLCRYTEFRLRDTEWLLCAATAGGQGDDLLLSSITSLDGAWKKLLLNQFHDVVPGSAIGIVYKDATQLYQEADAAVQQVWNNTLTSLFGSGANDQDVIFNSLQWPRREVVDLAALKSANISSLSGEAASKSGEAASKSGEAASKSGEAASKSGEAASKSGDAAPGSAKGAPKAASYALVTAPAFGYSTADSVTPDYPVTLELSYWSVPGGEGAWVDYPFSEIITKTFTPTNLGSSFGPTWSTHWFKVELTLPAEWEGQQVNFRWNSDSEATLWSETGVVLQGLSSTIDDQVRTDYRITGSYDGTTPSLTYYVEMAGSRICGTYINDLIDPPPSDLYFTLRMAEVAVMDQLVYKLTQDLVVLSQLCDQLPDDARGYSALFTANQMVNSIIAGDDQAASDLADLYFSKGNGERAHQLAAIGNCHIDSAWLWPYSETKRKVARSFSSQLALMDRYPDFCFVASQVPSLFPRYLVCISRYLVCFSKYLVCSPGAAVGVVQRILSGALRANQGLFRGYFECDDLVSQSWCSNAGAAMLVEQCWWSNAGAAMLVEQCWWSNAGGAVLVQQCWCSNAGGAVLVEQCWWGSAGGAVLVEQCWWSSAGGAVLVEQSWCSSPGAAVLVQQSWCSNPGAAILVQQCWWSNAGAAILFQIELPQILGQLKRLTPLGDSVLQTRVSEGRFLPVGGTWVEMDGNIPSGESFVRQFLHGQRFFEEELGVRCKEFWLPDTFGYSPQIPGIMRHVGLTRFLTQKMSWSFVNKFPHHNFTWRGIDGSTVLAHFPPGESYSMNATVKEARYTESNLQDKGRVSTSAFLYGYGD